jgi:hypothetical protein
MAFSMFYWFSPFTLLPAIKNEITQAGGLQWDGLIEVPGTIKLFLLYQPPHELLHQAGLIAEGYAQICKYSSQGTVLNLLRLIDPFSSVIFSDDSFQSAETFSGSLPDPEPLKALVTLAMLKETPDILDAYIDLEMRADLASAPPDTTYLLRLRNAAGSTNAIASFNLLNDPSPVMLAREEAELTMLELHSVQEELQEIYLSDRDNLERIRAADLEVARLSDELDSLSRELGRTRDELISIRSSNKSRDASFTQLDIETKNLREELVSRQQFLAQALQDLGQCQHNLQNTSDQLAIRDQHLASVLHELQLLQTELQALRLEDASKLECIQSYDLELATLRNECKNQAFVIADLHEKLNQLNLASHNQNNAINLLRAENGNLEAEILKLQHQLARSLQDVCDFKQQLQDISQGLASRECDLVSAREDADLTQLQLHQIQEELEHIFLENQAQRFLIDAQKEQLERAARLFQGTGGQKGIPLVSFQPSIQVLALLEGYRHSLKRAERLLQRASPVPTI